MGEDQIFNLYTLYNLWLLPQMIVNTEIFLVQSFLYAVLAFMFTLYTFYNLWFIPKIVDMVKIISHNKLGSRPHTPQSVTEVFECGYVYILFSIIMVCI